MRHTISARSRCGIVGEAWKVNPPAPKRVSLMFYRNQQAVQRVSLAWRATALLWFLLLRSSSPVSS